eukprot:GEMP01014740.1.p1 GENE.GEMP01014740.1~~GEMP01014740.1.p1  ORF type:complete len:738 (+),score=182.95 GEMP01014740.1:50-2263(+)
MALTADVRQWAENEIRQLFHGTECNGMMINVLLEQPDEKALNELLLNYFNEGVPKYADKVAEFAAELFRRRKKATKKMKKDDQRAAVDTQQKLEQHFPKLNKDAKAAINPNRRVCLCQGMEHGSLGNCLNCGKINCVQEGPGPCLFCEADLTQVESPDAALQKAIALKDQLVDYDGNSKKRTKVYDDSTDWFSETANPWLTQKQRKHAEEEGKRQEEEKRIERRKMHLTFDLFGRTVVEAPPPSAAKKEQEREDFENWVENAAQNEKEEFMQDVTGSGVNPQLHGSSKRLYDELKQSIKNTRADAVSSTAKVNADPEKKPKVQTNVFDNANFNFKPPTAAAFKAIWGDEDDEGRVLSLHQPWASLIIHGFKRAEGRSWKTPYRGRLWIHAAAKPPDQETLAQLEHKYETIYRQAGLEIPKLPSETNGYPTSCLLGCVDFTQCWTQEEYTDVLDRNPQMPREESDCEYVFFIHNPRRCVVPIPMNGDHKIWSLSKKRLPDYQTKQQKLQQVKTGSLSEAKQLLLLDGCVVLENFINFETQQKLVDMLREIGLQSNGWYSDHFAGGQKASVMRVSLGAHWDAPSGKWMDKRADGTTNPHIPPELVELYKLGVRQGSNALPKRCKPFPTDGKCAIAIVNFYNHQAKLGVHQDKTESRESIQRGDPVISICLGDDCDMSYSMEPPTSTVKPKIARLKNGDAIIFGGVARLMWHGIHKIIPHTGPPELNLIPGRLSITLRCR